MLLKPFLRTVVGIGGFASGDHNESSLHLVRGFTFGDRYTVLLKSGGNVEFKDLFEMVDMIADELRVSPTYDVGIVCYRRELSVMPKNEMGRPWGRNIRKIKEDIIAAVTEFNLTGEWPSWVTPAPSWRTL